MVPEARTKTVNYTEVILALTYYGLIHQNKACRLRYSEFCKLSTATRYFTYSGRKYRNHNKLLFG